MARRGKGQKVKVASGQTYGKGVAQEESQQAIPLHREPTAAPPMTPGQFGPPTRPSERPREALTAGDRVGPGVGPQPPAAHPIRREDPTPRLLAALPLLEELAAAPGASRQVVRMVTQLRAASANMQPTLPV